jgi:Domain of unknown function (DUF4411)
VNMAQALIWVIDTSSIIAVRRLGLDNSRKSRVFGHMGELVLSGRLVYPKEVVEELERFVDPRSPDEQFKWARTHEAKACARAPTLERVKEVLEKVSSVLDPDKDSGVEEADPYILAMACQLLAEGNDVRLVTEEKADTPRKMSLNTAAGLLRLPSVPLKAFLAFEEIDT